MEHIAQEIMIRIEGVVTGKPLNAKERKALMTEEVVEESFEEAGSLASSARVAVRAPKYNSRKANKAELKADRLDNAEFEFAKSVDKLKTDLKFAVAEYNNDEVDNVESVKAVLAADDAVANRLRIVKNLNTKNPSKPAKRNRRMYKESFRLDSSWENKTAMEDDLQGKGFEDYSYYDVEARDEKGLKLGTIRVQTKEEAEIVAKNVDFRKTKQDINKSLKREFGIC